MPLEQKQSAYVILQNRDGFVKLKRITYNEIEGPPWIMRIIYRPKYIGQESPDEAEFRQIGRITAGKAQDNYGLLIRAEYAILYEEQ